MHAMRDGTEKPFPDIQRQRQDYESYLNGLRQSCNPGDLPPLLHGRQDENPPGHRGFQCWGNLTLLGLIGHVVGDTFRSNDAWERAVTETANEIAAYKIRCPCACN